METYFSRAYINLSEDQPLNTMLLMMKVERDTVMKSIDPRDSKALAGLSRDCFPPSLVVISTIRGLALCDVSEI